MTDFSRYRNTHKQIERARRNTIDRTKGRGPAAWTFPSASPIMY
jgi:hypothetical protein